MLKKENIFIILFILVSTFLFAENRVQPVVIDSVKVAKWQHKNQAKLTLTQNAFVNWSAGGDNSIAGILLLDFERNYKDKSLFWDNKLKLVYGVNKKEETPVRKTEDVLKYDTTFGYKSSDDSNWYYSAKLSFNTQFSKGYKYPNREKAISKFFAPAYLFFGVGAEYKIASKNIKVYMSPVTNKSTFVFDEDLANEGAFGVKKAMYDDKGLLLERGECSKVEIGTLVTAEWKAKLMKNILMKQKLSLYSDYLNKYGNVDINWQVSFDMTVNKYIQATLGTHILYDDDIKYKEDTNNDGQLETFGARTQLKQLLGIGISYIF